MSDISAPGAAPARRPDGSAGAVGALWVAGLGAFLLVVAAVTFVAMRWDDIPDGGKFAALVAVTAVCLALHRALRRSFPLTAAAIFHLGVLLVPVDVAAIGVRLGYTWPEMLLTQGLAATVAFGLGARWEDSVVLRWGTWAAVVALAGGIGATTAVPAGLLVAGVALVATNLRHPRAELAAVGWAALAGLAVPLAGARDLDVAGAGVLDDLGLTAPQPAVTALVTGLLAGVALGRLGARRASVPLALTGIACAIDGVAVAWATLGRNDPVGPPDLATVEAAVAAGVLLAELAAWIWSRDGFWSRPTAVVAYLGEAIAAIFTLGMGLALLVGPFDPERMPALALAAGFLSLTWIAAIARRPMPQPRSRPVFPAKTATPPATVPGAPARAVAGDAGRDEVVWLQGTPDQVALWKVGPVLAAVTATAAVMLTTGSGTVTAVALAIAGIVVLALAAAWLPDPRMTSGVLAVGLVAWAPVAGYDNAFLAAGLGAAGALATAGAVVILTSRFPGSWVAGPASRLSTLAVVPLQVGGLVSGMGDEPVVGIVVAIVGAWLLAAILDQATVDERASAQRGTYRPWVPARAAILVPLAFTPALTPEPAVGVAVLAGLLLLIDAIRRDAPRLLVGTGIAVPVALTATALAVDGSPGEAGLALCFTGLAWLGLSAVLPARWAPPALVAAVIAGGWGLLMAADDPATFSTGLLVVGVAVVGFGLVADEVTAVRLGALATAAGYWGHLGRADVVASEPYLLPLAVFLLAAGIADRRSHGSSSWMAHAPAVALFGGAALVERLSGGPGWHGLVAGGVGLVAVVAGGNWRLAGPLLTGTALLVALAIHETLDVTRSFPNWVWFALAGTLLLSAGLVMERRSLGPVESGRRLLDVVQQRFS